MFDLILEFAKSHYILIAMICFVFFIIDCIFDHVKEEKQKPVEKRVPFHKHEHAGGCIVLAATAAGGWPLCLAIMIVCYFVAKVLIPASKLIEKIAYGEKITPSIFRKK
jgi:hypothetical protein